MTNPTPTQHLEAELLAQKIAGFIRHNKIDLTAHTIDEIVGAYHKAQLAAISKAASEIYEQLLIDGAQ